MLLAFSCQVGMRGKGHFMGDQIAFQRQPSSDSMAMNFHHWIDVLNYLQSVFAIKCANVLKQISTGLQNKSRLKTTD